MQRNLYRKLALISFAVLAVTALIDPIQNFMLHREQLQYEQCLTDYEAVVKERSLRIGCQSVECVFKVFLTYCPLKD